MRRAWPVLPWLLLACQPGQTVRGHVEILGAGSSAGVSVRVAESDGAATVTDDRGDFTVLAWSSRPTLIVSADSALPPMQTVQATGPVELVFTAVGTIQGTATRGGAPTGNAGIAISAGGMTAVTDDSGRYALSIPTGTAIVQASTSGYASASSAPHEVRRGELTQVEPIVLPLTGYGWSGTLKGSVERVSSDRRDGVRVLVEGAGRFAVTGEDGVFVISDVPEGSYTLAFEHDGLVERVPGVMAARGSDGLLVDTRVYRLGDTPIPLMAATRLQAANALLAPPRGPFVAWSAASPDGTRFAMWSDVRTGEVIDAGLIESGWVTSLPSLTPDAGALIWQRGRELMRTSTTDRAVTVLASGVQRPVGYDGNGSRFPISEAGLIAFEGYADEHTALLVAGEDGSGVREVKRWGDANAHVGSAAFYEETLVAVSDISNQAPSVLTVWRDGAGVVRTTNGSQYVRASPSGRWVELRDYWSWNYVLIDARDGSEALSQSGGEGMFSTDSTAWAWVENGGPVLADLPGGTRHVLARTPSTTWASNIVCVEPEAVLVSSSDGLLFSVPRDGSAAIQIATNATYTKCGGGRVYWSSWTSGNRAADVLESAPVLGGPVARHFQGPVAGWTLLPRPEDRRIWFTVGDGDRRSLWTAPGAGPAVKVLDAAGGSLSFSPDGQRVAMLAGGLWVGRSDGTGFTRLTTGGAQVYWVDARRLVLAMAAPAAPLRFQGGVWLATVP